MERKQKAIEHTYLTAHHFNLPAFLFTPSVVSDVLCLFSCPCYSRTGWFGTVVEYGAERKISRHSVLSATVSVGVPQGVTLKLKYWPSQNMSLLSCSFLSVSV